MTSEEPEVLLHLEPLLGQVEAAMLRPLEGGLSSAVAALAAAEREAATVLVHGAAYLLTTPFCGVVFSSSQGEAQGVGWLDGREADEEASQRLLAWTLGCLQARSEAGWPGIVRIATEDLPSWLREIGVGAVLGLASSRSRVELCWFWTACEGAPGDGGRRAAWTLAERFARVLARARREAGIRDRLEAGGPSDAESALRELWDYARSSRGLVDLQSSLDAERPLPAFLRVLAGELGRRFHFDHAEIALLDQEQGRLQRFDCLPASQGSDFHPAGSFEARGTAVEWVAQHVHPVRNDDSSRGHRFDEDRRLLREGFLSYVAVPLVAAGGVPGALLLAAREAAAFPAAVEEGLRDVGHVVGPALRRALAAEERLRERSRFEGIAAYLREELLDRDGVGGLVASSPSMLRVVEAVERAAASGETVWIQGAPGTGRRTVARWIHRTGPSRSGLFVRVPCGAMAPTRLRRELFGGEVPDPPLGPSSRLDLARGGTLFLENVEELSWELQTRLLAVLRTGPPLLSPGVGCRILVSSRLDPEQAVRCGRMRSDLCLRLAGERITLPPLRERAEDIAALAECFARRFAVRLGKVCRGVSQAAIEQLEGRDWPGNLHELENVMEQAVLHAAAEVVTSEDLVLAPRASREAKPLDRALAEQERAQILDTLEKTAWVVEGPRGAARVLGLAPNTLRHRMRKLGVSRGSPETGEEDGSSKGERVFEPDARLEPVGEPGSAIDACEGEEPGSPPSEAEAALDPGIPGG